MDVKFFGLKFAFTYNGLSRALRHNELNSKWHSLSQFSMSLSIKDHRQDVPIILSECRANYPQHIATLCKKLIGKSSKLVEWIAL